MTRHLYHCDVSDTHLFHEPLLVNVYVCIYWTMKNNHYNYLTISQILMDCPALNDIRQQMYSEISYIDILKNTILKRLYNFYVLFWDNVELLYITNLFIIVFNYNI